jgi:hypothetical protein
MLFAFKQNMVMTWSELFLGHNNFMCRISYRQTISIHNFNHSSAGHTQHTRFIMEFCKVPLNSVWL